jgi:hypothetical protein
MSKFIFILLALLVSSHSQALTCSDALENQLAELPDVLTQPRAIDVSVDIDKSCITASMDLFYSWTDSVRVEREEKNEPSIGHYGYCVNSQQKNVNRLHIPPCQSELYTTVVQNSYNDVLKCLNLDPKKLFAITAVESGFHINTFSLSGQDIGIGQLIPAAITEVNQFWDESLAEIKASSNPACQNIQPFLADMISAPSEGKEQACAMMALPENPVRNLLYKGLLQQFHEKKMSKYFDQTGMKNRLQSFTGEEWSAEELKSLQEILVFLAYNAGSQGTKDIFEAFISLQQNRLTEWDQKYNELYSYSIDYFLRAMELGVNGYTKESDELLEARNMVQIQMNDMVTAKKTSYLAKSLFFISQTPGSFGEYLVKEGKSDYLNILLKRIDFIENKVLNAPGRCATPRFLSGQ